MKTIKINKDSARPIKNMDVFENISYASNYPGNHNKIFKKLKNCKLYTITIIIDNLKYRLYKNKTYTRKISLPINSKYIELLYEYFSNEFGKREGHDFYAKLLEKYRPIWDKEKRIKDIDEYIIKYELEPRYKSKILKRFKDLDKLKKPRTLIKRERYYNLPEPLNHIDWRNPYDNIFVWEENNRKYYIRGGSGSSGQRENNSKFIYGFSLINQIKPIPSHIYLYSDENELKFIKKFRSLTVPWYDIGSNYHLPFNKSEEILKKTRHIEWKIE